MKKLCFISLLILGLMFIACTSEDNRMIEKEQTNKTTEEVLIEEEIEKDDQVIDKESEVNTESKIAIRTVALKGPTAMGMVGMMDNSEKSEYYDFRFNIVAAVDEITPMLVKKEVDLAAVPANLASVLYNNTEGEIQVLAINTLGVLYIVGTDEAIEDIEDLKGKTIYASGKGATPEYALNYILEKNKINKNDDVNIEWKSEHTECLMALLENPDSVALLPQPFVTTAGMKNDNIKILIDLNQEWEKIQEEKYNPSTLLTGVIIGRKEYIEQNPEAIETFMEEYEKSVQFVNENIEEASVLIEENDIVPAEVAAKAIPFCYITFISGAEMQTNLSGYLEVLFQQNPKSVGENLPDQNFYYIKE